MKRAVEALLNALPKKPMRRTEKILLSLSPTEKARLNALAQRMGRTPSALAWELVMGAVALLEAKE